MATVQKVHTREFKEEAVRLAQTSGKPITQVARELGISNTSIHQWRKELVERGKEAFTGKGHMWPSSYKWALYEIESRSSRRCRQLAQSGRGQGEGSEGRTKLYTE